jgi:cytochrome c551/c552
LLVCHNKGRKPFDALEDVMAEPFTAAAIATLLVQELAKSSAGEAGKKLVGDLWGAIARRFKGNAVAEETLAIVKAEPSAEAARDLETFLRREMKDGAFAAEVGQLAQQIINLQQTQTTRNVETHDNSTANVVETLNNSGSGDVVFGDKVQGDKVAGDKYV